MSSSFLTMISYVDIIYNQSLPYLFIFQKIFYVCFWSRMFQYFPTILQVECPVLLEDGMPGQREAAVFRHGRPPMCQHCPGSRRHAQQVMVVSIN